MTLSRQTPDTEAPDFRVPIDTVCHIISKAREFASGTVPTRSAQAELMQVIHDLPHGSQIDLVALMWLGRGEGPDNWTEAQQLATQEHNDETAAYLVGTPLLSVYLEEGLAAVGRDCGDYEETNV